jgi:hypothetical protein
MVACLIARAAGFVEGQTHAHTRRASDKLLSSPPFRIYKPKREGGREGSESLIFVPAVAAAASLATATAAAVSSSAVFIRRPATSFEAAKREKLKASQTREEEKKRRGKRVKEKKWGGGMAGFHLPPFFLSSTALLHRHFARRLSLHSFRRLFAGAIRPSPLSRPTPLPPRLPFFSPFSSNDIPWRPLFRLNGLRRTRR